MFFNPREDINQYPIAQSITFMRNAQILPKDKNMVRHLIFLFFILNVILLLGFIVLPEARALATVPLFLTVSATIANCLIST